MSSPDTPKDGGRRGAVKRFPFSVQQHVDIRVEGRLFLIKGSGSRFEWLGSRV